MKVLEDTEVEDDTVKLNQIQQQPYQMYRSTKLDKLINMRMLPAKMCMFFKYGMFGCYLPYLNVFLISIGLRATQAGFITGLRTIISFLMGPIWGALADRSGHHKLIYLVLCFGTLTMVFPLPWIAQYTAYGLLPGQSLSSDYRLNNQSFTNSTSIEIPEPTIEMNDNTRTKLFWTMLGTLFLSALFGNPLMGYFDFIVMNLVSASKKRISFGSQRMYGSIGFGIGSFLAGLAADHYHSTTMSSYTAVYYAILAPGALMIPLGLISISRGNWELTESHKEKNIAKLIFKIFAQGSNIIFLITILIMGLAIAMTFGYMLPLMSQHMAASKSIMGLAIIISCAAEVFMFPVASKVINFLGGPMPCIILAVFSYFVRFFIVSYLENPLLVIPLQALHCISFGLFWAAAMQHVEAISPPNVKATMFLILNSTHFSLGTAIGNMLGGVFYEKFGGRMFFRSSSFVFLTWSVLLAIYFYGSKCFRRNQIDRDSENCSAEVGHK